MPYEILLQHVSIVPCLCVFGISHFGLYYLYSSTNHTIDKKVQKLLALLLGIYQKGVVKEVILGYEPADDDMMILRVARKQIEMLNENVFNSRWACSVYNFAKHMKL